jgi:hypothetical protein
MISIFKVVRLIIEFTSSVCVLRMIGSVEPSLIQPKSCGAALGIQSRIVTPALKIKSRCAGGVAIGKRFSKVISRFWSSLVPILYTLWMVTAFTVNKLDRRLPPAGRLQSMLTIQEKSYITHSQLVICSFPADGLFLTG